MKQKQLLEVIGAMKHQILDLLINQNLADDEVAQQTLSAINEMFSRLDLEIEDVIPQETLTAYFGGVDEATKALDKAGIDPKGGLAASISSSGKVRSAFNNHVHMEAIPEITDNAMLDLKAAIRTPKKNTSASIETALSAVKKDLQSGVIQGKARKVTTQRVAESFAKEGMTSFITSDGKALPLDFYSQVVTRTNLKKANTDGALNRYKENDVQYVTVTGGMPTCHQCYPYRDIVFSLVDDGGDFPYLPPDTFPLHPNCNCSLRPYVMEYKKENEINDAKKKASNFDPEKDVRSKAQKESYEKQQRLNRINNYEKKRYADIRGVLGDDAPANLGASKRMKRANTDNYNTLIKDYQDVLKSIK